jgi:hypothetical protein
MRYMLIYVTPALYNNLHQIKPYAITTEASVTVGTSVLQQ